MQTRAIPLLLSLVTLSLVLSSCSIVNAADRFTVKLNKCIDGDTANFRAVGTVRFLYVDTPESTTSVEPYGKQAASYTCSMLRGAKTIQLEYDGAKKDRYKRTLAWVWVDGVLLQKLLVEQGFVEKFYDYGTYRYEAELDRLQLKAQKDKVGLWSGNSESDSPDSQSTYRNCTEMRKVYPNGVKKGHPAYSAKMDRDQDGWACEK